MTEDIQPYLINMYVNVKKHSVNIIYTPCQLNILLHLKENVSIDNESVCIVRARCMVSDFTFEWCKNLICNSNTVDDYVDGLKQGCLKCPYNNYNYCDYVLMHPNQINKPLYFNKFRCEVCDAVVPYITAVTATHCPNCGRKIRNKDLLGKGE